MHSTLPSDKELSWARRGRIAVGITAYHIIVQGVSVAQLPDSLPGELQISRITSHSVDFCITALKRRKTTLVRNLNI